MGPFALENFLDSLNVDEPAVDYQGEQHASLGHQVRQEDGEKSLQNEMTRPLGPLEVEVVPQTVTQEGIPRLGSEVETGFLVARELLVSFLDVVFVVLQHMDYSAGLVIWMVVD